MFPRNSAWDNDAEQAQRELEANMLAHQLRPREAEVKTVAIPVSKLEEWVSRLEEIAWDTPDAIAADGLADELRSYFPG